MPDVLQAYTSEFRQKSTTFVMACSIVGMMGHSGTFDAGEAHRVAENLVGTATSQRHTQLARHCRSSTACAALLARNSWPGTASAALRARHHQRGTAGAAPLLAPSSPSVRSIPEALPTRFCAYPILFSALLVGTGNVLSKVTRSAPAFVQTVLSKAPR